MPLLCTSLLALLLLPLSLSCDGRSPKEVRDNFMEIVKTDLDNTRTKITGFLHNSSCPGLKQKLRSCASDNANIVSILHSLICKMKHLGLSHARGLVASVLSSIRCSCVERPTKEPNVKLRPALRQRRNAQRKNKETKNYCRAKDILSNITECYEILNTQLEL